MIVIFPYVYGSCTCIVVDCFLLFSRTVVLVSLQTLLKTKDGMWLEPLGQHYGMCT